MTQPTPDPLLESLRTILGARDLITSDKTTRRLPSLVEATLPTVLGKGVANGVAPLNGAGVPVDASGNPMARIGTTAGTAADAAATSQTIANLTSANNGLVAQINALVARLETLEARFDGSGYLKVDHVTPGTRLDAPAINGVQQPRGTTRTDIWKDNIMLTEPSQAPGMAIPGDGWRAESW